MALSAKRKALIFSSVLIALSLLFLGAAAASTGGKMRPLKANDGYGRERNASHNGVALAIRVSEADERGDQNLTPMAGVHVKVFRVAKDDRRGELAKEGDTGERGAIVFQLRPGMYRIELSWDNHTANSPRTFPVKENMRVGVVIGPDGSAHWGGPKPHRDMERRGETASLAIRVGYNHSGERAPAANATVTIFRPLKDGHREVVAHGATNGRGVFVAQIHHGAYGVEVSWDGKTAMGRAHVKGDMQMAFLFDGDSAHVRGGGGRPRA